MKRSVRLTPREVRCLIRYFDGVDDVVTARLVGGFDQREEHLTFLLCEMLDDNLANLSSLPYPLPKLREDLALEGRPLNVQLSIEAKTYPPQVEGRLTFADLGIVVSYRDNISPPNSFERGALFQAKRLHRSRYESNFSLFDAFSAFDVEQLQGLAELDGSDLIHREPYDCTWDGSFCFYLFFCPRPQAYDQQSQEDLRSYAIPTLDEHHFHHMEMSFHELVEAYHALGLASDPTRHFPALLASRICWLKDKYLVEEDKRYRKKGLHETLVARAVYEHLWDDVAPFSWFLVYRMLLGWSGSCGSNALRIARGEFELNRELGGVPRYVMTIGIQVGTPRG